MLINGAIARENSDVAASSERADSTLSPIIDNSINLTPKMRVGKYSGITISAIKKLPRRTVTVKLAAIAPMKLSAGVPINRLTINQPQFSIGRLKLIANIGERIVSGRPVVNQ